MPLLRNLNRTHFRPEQPNPTRVSSPQTEPELAPTPEPTPAARDCAVRRDLQSRIDIDMIRVVRRDRSQPDYLSVSSGYTTDGYPA
uniref:Uncharacterized protein n=1 Tax=Cucumis melo TaxID=3656 RepID=A0A9I9EKW4_CUCME